MHKIFRVWASPVKILITKTIKVIIHCKLYEWQRLCCQTIYLPLQGKQYLSKETNISYCISKISYHKKWIDFLQKIQLSIGIFRKVKLGFQILSDNKISHKKYLFYQTPLGIFLTLLCINFIIFYKGIVFSFPTPSMGYFHQVTTPTSILYDSPTKPSYCLHIVYLTWFVKETLIKLQWCTWNAWIFQLIMSTIECETLHMPALTQVQKLVSTSDF